MKECPKCKSSRYIKDGLALRKQRYKCKDCYYSFTVTENAYRGTKEVKRQALQLYLEGLGFRSIGRILKYSHVSIYNWIKKFGSNIKNIQSSKKIKNLEMDEMHTYVSKKTTNGYGYLLIELKKSSLILLSEEEI
ncbi:MAG: IS1 family transposase [Bacteroidetes bacterium]|nr:IS1 family transposase [Bacteroidota bacterium]